MGANAMTVVHGVESKRLVYECAEYSKPPHEGLIMGKKKVNQKLGNK